MVDGEILADNIQTDFARSNEFKRNGTYSFEVKKTGASGTVGYVGITDNHSSGDMHGLIAGKTYTFSAWAYTGASAGSYDISEVSIRIGYADSVTELWANTYSTAPTVADEWQRLTVTKTLSTAAVGAYVQLAYHAGPAANETCYFDDITLTCLESTGANHNVGFLNLKEYDNNLYGINDKTLYQLDVEGMDEKTTAESIGINWKMKSAYHDQENPNPQASTAAFNVCWL